MNATTLQGCRVVITREAADAESWRARLAELGAAPVLLPCIAVERIDTPEVRRELREAIIGAEWLLLFSAHAAEAVAHFVGKLPERVRVCAVGGSTAAAARRLLRAPEFVPAAHTSRDLAHALIARVAADHRNHAPTVVIAAAAEGLRDADDALAAAGFVVKRVAVYTTREAAPETAKQSLRDVDYVLLASPSAVRGFVNRVAQPVTARVVTIGPTTSAAARAAGLTVHAEATHPSLEGLLEAMC